MQCKPVLRGTTDQVFFYSAVVSWVVVGKLYDPISWVLVGAMWLVGHFRAPIWWIVVGAAVATAVNVATVWTWWAELGYADQWPSKSSRLLVGFLVISAIVYGIGRLTANVFARGQKQP
jgi:hypothetical protein